MKQPEYTEDWQLVVLHTKIWKVTVELTEEIKESLATDPVGTVERLKEIVLLNKDIEDE